MANLSDTIFMAIYLLILWGMWWLANAVREVDHQRERNDID